MSPAQYVSVSLATCVGLCRFGEAWAALRAENFTYYLDLGLFETQQLGCDDKSLQKEL